VVVGVALMYYLAPAVEHRTWYWITPGSLVATVAWVTMSLGLRVYVNYFGNYTATYGSIAGVILLLLWLYLSGLVLLLGAEINAEIEHAAAEEGAPSAKAEGEQAPGVPGPPPRTEVRAAAMEIARERAGPERLVTTQADGAYARAAARASADGDDADDVTIGEIEAIAHRRAQRVAGAAAGVVHGVRAVPWVAAWAGLRLLARTTRTLSRHRIGRRERVAHAERAAAAVASIELERARATERARNQLPPIREAG